MKAMLLRSISTRLPGSLTTTCQSAEAIPGSAATRQAAKAAKRLMRPPQFSMFDSLLIICFTEYRGNTLAVFPETSSGKRRRTPASLA